MKGGRDGAGVGERTARVDEHAVHSGPIALHAAVGIRKLRTGKLGGTSDTETMRDEASGVEAFTVSDIFEDRIDESTGDGSGAARQQWCARERRVTAKKVEDELD